MKRIFSKSKSNKASASPAGVNRRQPLVAGSTGSKSPLERTVPVAEPQEVDGQVLKTHIEVCARVRPLQVQNNGQGYFAAPQRRLLGGLKPKGPTTSTVSSTKKGLREIGSAQLQLDELVAWDVSGDGETAAQSSKTSLIQGRTHSYTLDHVYGPESSTKDVYERSVQSLVDRAMEGYHSTILAYGQTNTGKTFTMSGTKGAPGLIPMTITDCFRYVRHSQESREYLIRISYLEIYKEHIRDLLNPTPEPIRLFDGPDGLVIRGLKEEVVSTPEQVYSILAKGEKRRQVGATHMNQHSSRSHVIVRLWIESTAVGEDSTARVSSLSLVDLAGSESVRLNGTDRREEGHYINKSLMTLGQVVLSLSEGKTGHVPYRDSKLTRLLQPSLSGNAQMVLLCCISPQASHLEESHNTFKFAARAKKVEQKAIINVAGEDQTLLQNYKTEIDDLRNQLAEAKEQQRLLLEKAKASHKESNASAETTDGEIEELVDAITTMERLILKSRPHQDSTRSPSSDASMNDDLDLLLNDDDDDDDMLIDLPPRTPPKRVDDPLQAELHRIRGLLGSVLQKRGTSTPKLDTSKRLDFSTPPRTPAEQKEVETLRKQLELQETATNLRKADSSFLQAQLQEKDKLLEEISKVLEAVEKRQTELEEENTSLRDELRRLRGK